MEEEKNEVTLRQDVSPNQAKREESKEFMTTGATGKDVPKDQKKTDTRQKKLIAAGTASGVLVVAIALLIFAVMGSTPSECDLFLQDIFAQKEPSVTLGPIEMAECYETACDFDYAQCDAPCPFGYARDAITECENSCDCATKGVFQGDIQFDEDGLEEMMKDYGYVSKEKDFELFNIWAGDIWNNIEIAGRFKIPYELSFDLDVKEHKIFNEAIGNLSKHTCLDFIPRVNDEKDYVVILNTGRGCGAFIGREGGRQTVRLAYGCFFEATIQHELFHTLGIDHEHTRQDRDSHVDIYWDRIKEGAKSNYNKKETGDWKDLYSPYELDSGMHYRSYSFAKKPGDVTLAGKGGILVWYIMQEHFLTEEDFREINILYDCETIGPSRVGEWNPWEKWGECSNSCGGGKQSRYRFCIYRQTGEKLAAGCHGLPLEVRECNKEECPPLVAEWTDWGSWGTCSKTCGKGEKMRCKKVPSQTKYLAFSFARSRTCPIPMECPGGRNGYFDMQPCSEYSCGTGEKITTPTFGEWTAWSAWQACDKTCGKGDKKATRKCMFEGDPMRFDKCVVDKTEPGISDNGASKYKDCDNGACGGGGTITTSGSYNTNQNQWGTWGQWSSCSVTCGWGKKKRTRTCPVSYCHGSDSSSYSCNSGTVCSAPTPVSNPEWGEWSEWSACDKTCGYGNKERTRKCSGSYCAGSSSMSVSCRDQACTSYYQSYGWGGWGQWSQCDQTCGLGSRKRTRTCNSGSCQGKSSENESCEAKTCSSEFGRIFEDSSTNSFKNICPYGKLFPGKFNKDRKLDLLCLYPDGFARLYFTNFRGTLADMISWEGPTIHCSFAEVEDDMNVYVRDINKDGFDDLICHNQHTKEIMVTYNKGGSFKDELDWQASVDECEYSAMFENIQGDDGIDLLCGDEKNPIKYVFPKKGGTSRGISTRSAISLAADDNTLKIQVLSKPKICLRKTKPGDRVQVRYTGTLDDGEQFDARNVPLQFTLGHGEVIDGWEKGLLEMCHGEERKLTVPPDMAYGDSGKPPSIPGNATLTYEIELTFQ